MRVQHKLEDKIKFLKFAKENEYSKYKAWKEYNSQHNCKIAKSTAYEWFAEKSIKNAVTIFSVKSNAQVN